MVRAAFHYIAVNLTRHISRRMLQSLAFGHEISHLQQEKTIASRSRTKNILSRSFLFFFWSLLVSFLINSTLLSPWIREMTSSVTQKKRLQLYSKLRMTLLNTVSGYPIYYWPALPLSVSFFDVIFLQTSSLSLPPSLSGANLILKSLSHPLSWSFRIVLALKTFILFYFCFS